MIVVTALFRTEQSNKYLKMKIISILIDRDRVKYIISQFKRLKKDDCKITLIIKVSFILNIKRKVHNIFID